MSHRKESRTYGQPRAEAYGLSSTFYPLNPIRLPPPQQHNSGSPALLPEPCLPYYASQQKPNSQSVLAQLPAGLPENHVRALATSQSNAERKDDIKRPRACEACRSLKVRCVPDPAKGSCRRCAKAGRQCVITLPSRKRQKKTDTRVAELERKIDALTASLQTSKSDSQSEGEDGSSDEGYGQDVFTSYNGGHQNHQTPAGTVSKSWVRLKEPPSPISPKSSKSKRKRTWPSDGHQGIDEGKSTKNSNITENGVGQEPPTETPAMAQNNKSRSISASNKPASQLPIQVLSPPDHEYADVVDRKIIDSDTATRMFDHYTKAMSPHMPAVVFRPDVTAGEIRKTKPVLFLAILSVASYQEYPKLQKILHKEITRVYAESIICKGEKSLELIQALQVSSVWFSPEDYKNARSYQLINMAVSMAIVLGLSQKKPFFTGLSTNPWKENKFTREPPGGGSAIERQRAWLSCFSLSGIAAAGLKQPNLLHWSPYLDECAHILETSSEALHTDRILCHSVKLQRLRDDLVARFENDVAYPNSTSDPHRDLMAFLQRIKDWEVQMPKNIYCPSQMFAYHVTCMQIRQIDVRLRYNVENLNPCNEFADSPSPNSNSGLAKTSEVDAVLECLKSLHRVLDDSLLFTVEEVRTMPTFHFLRVAYAVVCLVGLHRAAMNPNSELSKAIPIQSMDVESYVQRLLVSMQRAAADGKSRPAQSFQLALRMLLTWSKRNFEGPLTTKRGEAPCRFLKLEVQPVDMERMTPRLGYRKISVPAEKKSGSTTPREQPKLRTPSVTIPDQQASQAPPQPVLPNQPPPFSSPYTNRVPMGATPLDLLSQVATHDASASASASASVLHHPSTAASEPWYSNPYPPQLASGSGAGTACMPYATWQDFYLNQPTPYAPQDYPDNVDMYPGLNVDAGLDPAINVTYGEEGDLYRMFMDPLANSNFPVGGAQGFGEWPSGE